MDFETQDKFREECTCSICLELATNPRLLDCHHSFCTECIRLVSQGKDDIKCPLCRRLTKLREGVDGLQVDNLKIVLITSLEVKPVPKPETVDIKPETEKKRKTVSPPVSINPQTIKDFISIKDTSKWSPEYMTSVWSGYSDCDRTNGLVKIRVYHGDNVVGFMEHTVNGLDEGGEQVLVSLDKRTYLASVCRSSKLIVKEDMINVFVGRTEWVALLIQLAREMVELKLIVPPKWFEPLEEYEQLAKRQHELTWLYKKFRDSGVNAILDYKSLRQVIDLTMRMETLMKKILELQSEAL